jgi:hypothetical protein
MMARTLGTRIVVFSWALFGLIALDGVNHYLLQFLLSASADNKSRDVTIFMLGAIASLSLSAWLLFTVFMPPGWKEMMPPEGERERQFPRMLGLTVYVFLCQVAIWEVVACLTNLLVLPRLNLLGDALVISLAIVCSIGLVLHVRQHRPPVRSAKKKIDDRLNEEDRRQFSSTLYQLREMDRFSLQKLVLGFGLGIISPFVIQVLVEAIRAL